MSEHHSQHLNMSSGIYEYVKGQLYFYDTLFDVQTFVNNTIRQNQRIIDYFISRPLNPKATPCKQKKIEITNVNDTNKDDS